MAKKTISQIEREWFLGVSSGTAQTRLDDLKRRYYIKRVSNAAKNETTENLERAWLRAMITENGSTPSTTQQHSDLWAELVRAIGYTPFKQVNENKRLFYLNPEARSISVVETITITESLTAVRS